MPLVYCYFQPLAVMDVSVEHALIVLWQKSWRRSGFEPVILTHQHAEAHDKFEEFDKLVRSFPSMNPPGYDLACWHRWLALSRVGGGLQTDHDLIARAFSPEMLALPNDITVLDRGGVPCAVYTTPDGANQIVEDILAMEHKHDGRHYSDMIALQALGYTKAPELTAPVGADGWKDAPATHYSHHNCNLTFPGQKRTDIIRREEGLGENYRIAA